MWPSANLIRKPKDIMKFIPYSYQYAGQPQLLKRFSSIALSQNYKTTAENRTEQQLHSGSHHVICAQRITEQRRLPETPSLYGTTPQTCASRSNK
jgi:hypothetical protein